jgi:hypothetical protein
MTQRIFAPSEKGEKFRYEKGEKLPIITKMPSSFIDSTSLTMDVIERSLSLVLRNKRCQMGDVATARKMLLINKEERLEKCLNKKSLIHVHYEGSA